MNQDSENSIVVVGAGGFLGHRLCTAAAGCHVTALCRRAPTRSIAGATLEIGDRRDTATVARLLENRPALWLDTAVNDREDIEALIDGAGAAMAKGVPLPSFVLTSTFGEYGPCLARGLPIREDSPTGADDPHAEGKLRAFATLPRNPGFRVTWAILPMMWGPGDHDGTGPGGRTRVLIRRLLDCGLAEFDGTCDNPVPDGFVDTIAAALLFAGRLAAPPGIRRMILAGPENLTPRGFVEEAAAAMGRRVDIVVTAPGTAAMPGVFPGSRVVLDTSRLYDAGFLPADDWRSGVRKTVAAELAERAAGDR